MRLYRIVPVVFAALALNGCGSSAERAQRGAYEAQESVAKERLRLVERYRKCVKEADGDKLKMEACDTYLKSAEALK